MQRAAKMMRVGQFARAIAIYTRTIQARPDAPDRYCNRAIAHVYQHDLDAAMADYAEAIRLQSRYAPAWVGRASVELRRDNLQRAVDDATIAICLAPDNVDAAIVRGAAYSRLGEYEAALADLNEAVAAAPDSWPVYRLRAQAHFLAENYRAAIDDLTYFSGAWQRDESAGIELAVARFKLGEHGTALEIIETCVHDRPASSTAVSFYSLFLASCPDEKLRDGRRALELALQAQQFPAREELPCMAALAAAYAELGMFDRAVEFGRRAVEIAPDRVRARHEARLALYEARQPYHDWPQQQSVRNGDKSHDPDKGPNEGE